MDCTECVHFKSADDESGYIDIWCELNLYFDGDKMPVECLEFKQG